MKFAKRDYKLKKGKSLFLVPFGDIQTASEYGRLKDLAKWLLKRKKEGHQVGMFGMGDYFESPSPSDRAALKASKNGYGPYEELAKDIMSVYEKKTYSLAKMFEGLAPDILGVLHGHHFAEFIPQFRPDLPADSNQLLAQLWGCEYWGTDVQLLLNVNSLPFKIFASHGYGSARTPGARITKRIRMREVVGDAHWYCMGHDNEKSVYVTEALGGLYGREYLKQYYSGTGSFQRSYNFDEPEGTYAEKLLLPPSALGVVICMVRIQVDKKGEKRLDYHVST